MKTEELYASAKALVKTLRDERKFKFLVDVAAAYNANAPYDPEVVTWQAQGLIESGDAAKARKLLAELAADTPPASRAYIEARGLLGRAWKQTFFDTTSKSGKKAREAIDNSLIEYQACFDAEPGGSAWAGVNLLALSAFAKRKKIPVAAEIDIAALAPRILGLLEAGSERDNWYHASRAEAYLGMGDLENVEIEIGKYVRDNDTTAFALGGTLRQFTELWQLDRQGQRGRGIVETLRAALASKEQGHVQLLPDQVRQSLAAKGPSPDQLEAILGSGGQAVYDWWRKGLDAAQSVGVISHVTLGRHGTGFLVRRRDLFPANDPNAGEDLIVITNAHVICEPPTGLAIPFDDANIAFEAVDKSRTYGFSKVLWQSPVASLDCTLLELKEQPANIKPLDISRTIPPIPSADDAERPRVFVIGYPGGRQLTFSFEDNHLLDHEAPPQGTPPNPGICHVQYRAPTEGGSSGSPVFESALWRVIALHHAGSPAMPKLNGKAGTWPANEGIWIQSIVKAAGAANPTGVIPPQP